MPPMCAKLLLEGGNKHKTMVIVISSEDVLSDYCSIWKYENLEMWMYANIGRNFTAQDPNFKRAGMHLKVLESSR